MDIDTTLGHGFIPPVFNFNDPIEAVTIFRVQGPQGGIKEYSSKIFFSWEDIRYMEQYPYSDDWNDHKGPKYYLTLHGETQSKLILGDINSLLGFWTIFKNKYPLFADNNE